METEELHVAACSPMSVGGGVQTLRTTFTALNAGPQMMRTLFTARSIQVTTDGKKNCWKPDYSAHCPQISLDSHVPADRPWPGHLHGLLQVFIFFDTLSPSAAPFWSRHFQTCLINPARFVSAEPFSLLTLSFCLLPKSSPASLCWGKKQNNHLTVISSQEAWWRSDVVFPLPPLSDVSVTGRTV